MRVIMNSLPKRNILLSTYLGLEHTLHEIDSWITNNDYVPGRQNTRNSPLIIAGPIGCGKSSLITKWIEFHQKSHKKDNDLILYHFINQSPGDSSYSHCLYRIFNKLRVSNIQDAYQINMRVDILEDRLRMYFLRWLEIANSRQKQDICRKSQTQRKRIVLIIDGVGKYQDMHGKEEQIDWLPTEAPDLIRLIYTCNVESRAYQIFKKKLPGNIIHIPPMDVAHRLTILNDRLRSFPEKTLRSMGGLIAQVTDYVQNSSQCGNPLFLNMMLTMSFAGIQGAPVFDYMAQAEESDTVQQLFEKAASFYQQYHFPKQHLYKFLGLISITRNGLTNSELNRLIPFSSAQFRQVLYIFQDCITCYNGFYMLANTSLRQNIIKRMNQDVEALHTDILNIMEDEPLNVRKVDEQLYHLFKTQLWIRLKDKVTELGQFAILFTPSYKQDLCMYWQRLEQQHFDPVQEYNRTLENFSAQFQPNHQSLFVIVVQFCRFFKEFADFEASYTCEFRHPHLKGKYELKDIHMYKEAKDLPNFFYQNQQSPINELEQLRPEAKNSKEVVRELLKLHTDDFTKKPILKYYYYKRWLWIQLPWCALDVYSDFSEVMGKFSFNGEFATSEHENELSITELQIIKNAQLNSKKTYKPMTRTASSSKFVVNEVSQMNKTQNFRHITRTVGILPRIKSRPTQTVFHQPSEHDSYYGKGSQLRQPFRNMTPYHPSRVRDLTFDISFKEVEPDNVLVKLGWQVSQLSQHKIKEFKKQNYELQGSYNRLVNECRNKKLKLDALRSQLAKGQDKIKENEEVRKRIMKMQLNMEQVLERNNKADLECRRLEHIITCCFKNAARNDEWERGLERGVENMRSMITQEHTDMNNNLKEASTLDNQLREFKKWFKDKITYQNFTIDKVAEQFMHKANLIEVLDNGEKRREKIYQTELLPPETIEYYRQRLKDRSKIQGRLKSIKQDIKGKLREYKKAIQKFMAYVPIEQPSDILNIIYHLEKNKDLKSNIERQKQRREELEAEKNALEAKLHFLQVKSKKEVQDTDKIKDLLELLDQRYVSVEKRAHHYEQIFKKQELECSTAWTSIEQMLKVTQIQHEINYQKSDPKIILYQIADKLDDFKTSIISVMGTCDYTKFKQMFPESRMTTPFKRQAMTNPTVPPPENKLGDNLRLHSSQRNIAGIKEALSPISRFPFALQNSIVKIN